MKLNGPVFNAISGKAPTSAVIFLHGLGSNGDDLISLAPIMAEYLPDTVFISPNGAFPFDMAGFGYQWFSLADRDPQTMLDGVRTVEPIVNEFIDDVLAQYNLEDAQLALVGFSQGTMTALHVAPRREFSLAGVVGFSGALLEPDLLISEVVSKPDVCLVHGTDDDVVIFDAMQAAVTCLQANGFSVEAHARPKLPHSIDMEGIQFAVKFLKARLT